MFAKSIVTSVAAALLLTVVLHAQETHRTIDNPSRNPQDDTKQNSAAVPDAYTIDGHLDRIVVVRLKYKANLLAGMEDAVKKEHISNGVILSGIGSLRGFELHQVTNRDFPSQDTFEKDPMQPVDLVSMNGYIINGRIHAHMTIATPRGALAGHVEEGNEVFTFAIVTIGVFKDINLDKVDDKTYR